MKKLLVIAVAALAACTGCGNQDINNQEPQTDTPTIEYKLIGRYNYGGNACDWGDDSLVPLEAVQGHDGWLKATIGVPDSYVDFKIFRSDSGVSTGNSISADRMIVGTVIPVDTDGSGHNFTIYSNRTSLDVYYSPPLGKLFSLPEGSAFVVPTTEAGSTVDEYALIGKHAGDDACSKDC